METKTKKSLYHNKDITINEEFVRFLNKGRV